MNDNKYKIFILEAVIEETSKRLERQRNRLDYLIIDRDALDKNIEIEKINIDAETHKLEALIDMKKQYEGTNDE
jgi:hypothetical protein